jgi:hypothetical protein
MAWWETAEWERRPLVFVEDQLYHTADLLAALADRSPDLLAHTTVVGLDRAGPDTEATVAQWLQRFPSLQIVAPVRSSAPHLRAIVDADVSDAGAYARLIVSLMRPGGLLVQDVHLNTVTCVPADRWWETIYLAATVRGMFPTQPPTVRFLSNKRGYAATFGRDLAGAGFDPRDVMDKSELRSVVVPSVTTLLARLFPLILEGRSVSGARHRWLVAEGEDERRTIEDSMDLLLWPSPQGWELCGRQVRTSAAGEPVNARVPLKPSSAETQTWLDLIEDHLGVRQGLAVVDVGTRLGGAGVERAEATNLAARHVHTLRSRLRLGTSIATLDHAYRLAEGLTAGVVTLRPPSAG